MSSWLWLIYAYVLNFAMLEVGGENFCKREKMLLNLFGGQFLLSLFVTKCLLWCTPTLTGLFNVGI